MIQSLRPARSPSSQSAEAAKYAQLSNELLDHVAQYLPDRDLILGMGQIDARSRAAVARRATLRAPAWAPPYGVTRHTTPLSMPCGRLEALLDPRLESAENAAVLLPFWVIRAEVSPLQPDFTLTRNASNRALDALGTPLYLWAERAGAPESVLRFLEKLYGKNIVKNDGADLDAQNWKWIVRDLVDGQGSLKHERLVRWALEQNAWNHLDFAQESGLSPPNGSRRIIAAHDILETSPSIVAAVHRFFDGDFDRWLDELSAHYRGMGDHELSDEEVLAYQLGEYQADLSQIVPSWLPRIFENFNSEDFARVLIDGYLCGDHDTPTNLRSLMAWLPVANTFGRDERDLFRVLFNVKKRIRSSTSSEPDWVTLNAVMRKAFSSAPEERVRHFLLDDHFLTEDEELANCIGVHDYKEMLMCRSMFLQHADTDTKKIIEKIMRA